jgi:hypothetical protein
MAKMTEVNRLLFTYFFVPLSWSSIFGQIFEFENIGGSGNFLDFLFQDTF